MIPRLDPNHCPRILVIGDLMLDHYLWGHCDRVSPEAPVQVVNVSEENFRLGGAANVLVNLLALGVRAEIVGVLGEDVAATALAAELQAAGAGTDGLIVAPERPTTLKRRVVAAGQQLVRVDQETTAPLSDALAVRVLDKALAGMPGAAVVVLSDYAKGMLTPRVTQGIINHSRELGIPVVVDPKGHDYAKYRGATLITPNRKEASVATGRSLVSDAEIRAAGLALREDYQLEACLLTLSEKGMALFEAGGETRLPTQAREVFDVTGAGDTVVAALAVGLAAGQSLVDACRFANAAAGIVVGKVGSATTSLREIERAAAYGIGAAGKIRNAEQAADDLDDLRAQGKRIVFTNGCFDLLHAGHVRYLEAAARLGDALVVGLNDDASVRGLKGPSRPVNPLEDRALLLASLAAVTLVVPFGEPTPLELIRRLQPDVLVKGGDYQADTIVGADVVRARGGEVKVMPVLDGRSTTALIERILQARGAASAKVARDGRVAD